jgi:hypothetical protein
MCPRLLTNATNLDVTERGTPRPRPARAEPASPATTWRLGPNLQQRAAHCGAPYSARHNAGRPKGGRLLSPEGGLVGEGHDGQGDTAPKQARQLPPSRTRTLRSRADQAGHFCLYRIAASTRRSYGRHVHSCCDATPPRLTKRRGLRGIRVSRQPSLSSRELARRGRALRRRSALRDRALSLPTSGDRIRG